MTLVDTLYPHRSPSTGQTCLLCPRPSRLVVCLPADTAYDGQLSARLSAAIHPHVAVPAGRLDHRHFALWRRPDATEGSLLINPQSDPDVALTWCAGGPIGLLDLATTAGHVRLVCAEDVTNWHTTVAGTPSAHAWWRYHDDFRADPDTYPLADAVADFAAQPRITAMAAPTGTAFPADMYGPGLEALHAGDDAYAAYQEGLLLYGDGLIDLNGQLLLPAPTPNLVEQTLAERQLYHDRARRYLTALDPTVLLAAVRCYR
ncbi:MAG TPA: hypothetical protein VK453_12105 [Micromonosporaceae bacterium]|nr:hypothetical protein [Micromonosporaceae bacterium]